MIEEIKHIQHTEPVKTDQEMSVYEMVGASKAELKNQLTTLTDELPKDIDISNKGQMDIVLSVQKRITTLRTTNKNKFETGRKRINAIHTSMMSLQKETLAPIIAEETRLKTLLEDRDKLIEMENRKKQLPNRKIELTALDFELVEMTDEDILTFSDADWAVKMIEFREMKLRHLEEIAKAEAEAKAIADQAREEEKQKQEKEKEEIAEKAKTEERAKVEAENKVRAEAEAKVEAEKRAKIEAENKVKAEAEAREKARVEEENKVKAEAEAEKIKKEAKEKAEAEAKAKEQARQKEEAEKLARDDKVKAYLEENGITDFEVRETNEGIKVYKLATIIK